MMENRNQIRNVISQVFNKTGFYFLSLIKLTQILKLLEMPQTSQPNTILQYVFTGIIKLYEKYKQKISQHIYSEKFNAISKQMKDYLFYIFTHVHNNLIMRQQAFSQSMQINSYPLNSMNMYYGGLNSNFANMQQLINHNYHDQMKKIMQTHKMYPYYMMNSGLGHSNLPSNPLNSQIGASLSNLPNSITPNSYLNSFSQNTTSPNLNSNSLNIGTSPNFSSSYGQMMRNMPAKPTVPPIPSNLASNLMYGMNPYSPSITPSIPPSYSTQYHPGYPTSLINNYPQHQIQPQPYSHFMNPSDKNEIVNFLKNQNDLNNINTTQNLQKRNGSIHKINQQSQKLDKQKSLHKQYKSGTSLTPKSNNSQVLPQLKQKDNSTDFLPKKLPFKQTKRINFPNPQLKFCACRGYYQYDNTFICPDCKNKYHQKCLSLPIKSQQKKVEGQLSYDSQLKCAHCKIKTMDPLNKVQKVIGQFYLMNLAEKNFVTTLNFRPYEAFCRDKTSKYQLEVRCLRTGDHIKNLQITWPDQCQIKINNDKIVDIPALQTNSSLKKRKDYSVFITQNVYKNISIMNPESLYFLERVKFSLQLKILTQQQISNKKIRNDFTFALGIYLVQKLNADQLYAKILSQQKIQDKEFLNNLMKSTENQVQIDKITIRLTDPFSWDIIRTPVRGSKCIHAQCFDLKTFISLMYSAKNRTWKCPLCSKDSRKFMLDQYQLQLLKKAQQINPTPKEVAIFKQGKITFKIQKDSDDEQDEGVSSTKTKKITKDRK